MTSEMLWALANWPTFSGRCILAGIDPDGLTPSQITAVAVAMIRHRAPDA